MSNGWIGVDLDGTLAEYHGWHDDGSIGPPVPLMLARVKGWLAEGRDVRILTARVGRGAGLSSTSGRTDDEAFVDEQTPIIQAWCEKHLGRRLPVTCAKDFRMVELWDDRAVQVVPNTGRRADGLEE